MIVLLIFLLICSGLGIAAFILSFTKKCGEGFQVSSSDAPTFKCSADCITCVKADPENCPEEECKISGGSSGGAGYTRCVPKDQCQGGLSYSSDGREPCKPITQCPNGYEICPNSKNDSTCLSPPAPSGCCYITGTSECLTIAESSCESPSMIWLEIKD